MPPILGSWQDIFPHDVPFEAGSNQIGCRTNARMREVVEKAETVSFFGFRLADQIIVAVGNG